MIDWIRFNYSTKEYNVLKCIVFKKSCLVLKDLIMRLHGGWSGHFSRIYLGEGLIRKPFEVGLQLGQFGQKIPIWLNGWVFVYGGCGFESNCSPLVSSKEFLDIQATIECGLTLKRIRVWIESKYIW